MTYTYTGSTESFTVPAGVHSLALSVSGAQGGGVDFGGAPGPGGAVVTGDLPVTPGQSLTVLVGSAGWVGGGPTVGGGGGTRFDSHLGSGGGGSFVFDAAGNPLLVAGGGGGQSILANPPAGAGAGAGPGSTGGSGSGFYGSAETVATGASPTAAGIHGSNQYGSGTDGTGPAASGAPGVGGSGGNAQGDLYTGAGGGGGYYGGGGGGYAGGGGGGSGYADPSVTDLVSTDGAHTGSGTVSFTWALLPQTVTFTSALPATAVAGSTLDVTTTGGASGNPVTLSVDPSSTSSACTITGSALHLAHAGTCVVDADQAGDLTYGAAVTAQESILVTAAPSAVSLTSSTTVFGQSVEVTATVTAGGGTPAGTVQFAVDGDDVGTPVTLVSGSAQSPALTTAAGDALAAGGHAVTATYAPTDPTVVAAATGSTTVVVGQASTTTAVAVHASSISATVSAVAPGAGDATGTVSFSVGGQSVGTANVVDGAAVLSYVVPTGMTQTVAAVYSGDASFAASSASTSRTDPAITATVSSTGPTSHGWYRAPVTVTFHCTTNGAALTAPCPGPVRFVANGAGRSTSRTIVATDGGVATLTVGGINIDHTAPSVKVSGIKNGGVYAGKAPAARCVAHDGLSGVRRCTVSRRTSGSLTRYTATATDQAGNTTSTRGTYRVLSLSVQGASYRNGAFTVRAGHSYTLVVSGQASRPRYYDAALFPRKPSRRDMAFKAVGHDRWALGVTVDRSMRRHTYWNLGVKVGRTMHVIKVRVTR